MICYSSICDVNTSTVESLISRWSRDSISTGASHCSLGLLNRIEWHNTAEIQSRHRPDLKDTTVEALNKIFLLISVQNDSCYCVVLLRPLGRWVLCTKIKSDNGEQSCAYKKCDNFCLAVRHFSPPNRENAVRSVHCTFKQAGVNNVTSRSCENWPRLFLLVFLKMRQTECGK